MGIEVEGRQREGMFLSYIVDRGNWRCSKMLEKSARRVVPWTRNHVAYIDRILTLISALSLPETS